MKVRFTIKNEIKESEFKFEVEAKDRIEIKLLLCAMESIDELNRPEGIGSYYERAYRVDGTLLALFYADVTEYCVCINGNKEVDYEML